MAIVQLIQKKSRLFFLLALLSAATNPITFAQTSVQKQGQAQTSGVAPKSASVVQQPKKLAAFAKGYETEVLVNQALESHPTVKQFHHQIQGLIAQRDQVWALPDPTIKATAYGAPVETAAGRQRFALGVNQKYIRKDRRAASAKVIDAKIAAVQSSLLGAQLKVASQVRQAAYQAAFLQKAIEITKQDQQVLSSIETITLQAYKVKKQVTQRDVLNVQIEKANLENRLSELTEKLRQKQIELNYLLGYTSPRFAHSVAANAAANVEPLEVRWPGVIDYQPNTDWSSVDSAIESRPDILAQRMTVSSLAEQVELARLQAKPDFNFGLQWIATESRGLSPVANGDDALMLSVGFNLPVNKSRIRSAVQQASENSLAASQQIETLKRKAASQIHRLQQTHRRIQKNLDLYTKQILPKAERSLRLATQQYRHGKLDYDQLIQDWRSVLKFRLKKFELESQQNQVTAQLWEATGKIFPEGSKN